MKVVDMSKQKKLSDFVVPEGTRRVVKTKGRALKRGKGIRVKGFPSSMHTSPDEDLATIVFTVGPVELQNLSMKVPADVATEMFSCRAVDIIVTPSED
jgi:hypothetical protein